ncbi:MAG: hypothetical protein Kow0074_17640 [Candidatus Zixiibacteriota bacterium]
MHRIWRVVLVGAVCLMMAWPSLGLAYISPDKIVEADPISHQKSYGIYTSDPLPEKQSESGVKARAPKNAGLMLDVYILQLSWNYRLVFWLRPLR